MSILLSTPVPIISIGYPSPPPSLPQRQGTRPIPRAHDHRPLYLRPPGRHTHGIVSHHIRASVVVRRPGDCHHYPRGGHRPVEQFYGLAGRFSPALLPSLPSSILVICPFLPPSLRCTAGSCSSKTPPPSADSSSPLSSSSSATPLSTPSSGAWPWPLWTETRTSGAGSRNTCRGRALALSTSTSTPPCSGSAGFSFR